MKFTYLIAWWRQLWHIINHDCLNSPYWLWRECKRYSLRIEYLFLFPMVESYRNLSKITIVIVEKSVRFLISYVVMMKTFMTCNVSQLRRHQAIKWVNYNWLWGIHSCFRWYKNYKNPPKDATVIVEKKVALSVDTVLVICKTSTTLLKSINLCSAR